MNDVTFAKNVPTPPGVYIFKDSYLRVIYVGKAKNLKERLSYYQNRNLYDGKTAEMIKMAGSVDWITTVSEADALILESDLIKTFKPKYNRLLMDDKSYQYLKISKKVKVKSIKYESSAFELPTVSLVRKKENDGSEYFGPYPVGSSIKTILKYLRKIYNFRDCSTSKFKRHQKLGRGCLYYDLKLCGAPCAGLIPLVQYQENIKVLKIFIKIGSTSL